MKLFLKSLLVGFFLLTIVPCGLRAQSDGPTPYPDPKDPGAWPGQGPIRVYSYMEDNRKSFWPLRAKSQGSVVFAGDSLIAGYKVREAFPNLQVANRGVGGDVSRGLLFRFKEDVVDLNPQAVVLCIGTNDLSCHSNPALAVENIGEMIYQLREANPKVPIVLLLVPPRDVADAPIKEGALAELNAGIRQLGEGKENLEIVDVYTPMVDGEGKPKPELFDAKKIHPNADGYVKWTELISPAFEKLGVK